MCPPLIVVVSTGAPASGPGGNGGILMESSGYVLMEDGSYILLE